MINKIFILFLLSSSFIYGQMEEYTYKRELVSPSDQWHELSLPQEVFGKTTPNLKDIRIYGITASNDTIEAPYLLRVSSDKVVQQEVEFKTLNTVQNNNGYYFTFELPSVASINQIKLDFIQQNFDWKVKLEGSQDQNEWFTVLKDYRIMSIRNAFTDFQFTQLSFPSSKFRYYRLHIRSKVRPALSNTSIAQHEKIAGELIHHTIKKLEIKENKQNKQTEIDVEMTTPVRASRIKIDVQEAIDYHRPVTIKYLIDSTKTEKGWIYNYGVLSSGTLNSLTENELSFKSTTLKQLKIIVHNHDNQALKIDSIQVSGYSHKLVARFTTPARYFLCYGNQKAKAPTYDIQQFADQIPSVISSLKIGQEINIKKDQSSIIEPLFKNKSWLWITMGVIILLLGGFSLKMIQKK